jgi:magnesium transporter
MIRTIYFPKAGTPQSDLPVSSLRPALADPDGLLWVSLEQPTDEEFRTILDNLFHFHPLAIEDCQTSGYQTPKIDDYGSYIFMVALAITSNDDRVQCRTEELNIFLGNNYVVSAYHAEQMAPVHKLWQRLTRDERLYNNGADFLCHALLDYLVDDYIPHLDTLEDEIEVLEDAVLKNPDPKTLSKIIELKHYIMTLRRVVAPQREMVNNLSRDDYPMIDRQSRIYFRDIYDHLVRIYEIIDVIRDMATSTLEVYLNATSVRLNEVMKALTIVSTIFLPLSFVAGIYGMNFKFFPEINWPFGYIFVWVIFILIATGMLTFFKIRKWF